MENIKKEYIYGAAGLVIGALVVLLVALACRAYNHGDRDRMMMDGRMMKQEMMKDKMNGMMGNDKMMMEGKDNMGKNMHSMTMALEGKTGDEFDKAFLSEMIAHHQGAIDMANLALKNAQHQEIKDLAQKIITAQNAEIEQMKQWQQTWYK